MNPVAVLDDAMLRLRIRLAGMGIERAVLLGDIEVAESCKVVMYALIAQRMDAAEQRGECFFAAAGEVA